MFPHWHINSQHHCKFDAKNQKTSDAMNDINAMSAAELKSELIEMGISITDCFEKSDLRTRLLEARSRKTRTAWVQFVISPSMKLAFVALTGSV